MAVEIFSLTKSYNMAGWRIGFCLGNQRMIKALARIKSYLDYGAFQPIQIASIIALRDCEEEVGKIRAVYEKRRNLLVDGLNSAGWPLEMPKATMFVWAPIPEALRGFGSLEFSKLLLERALVAVLSRNRIWPGGRRLCALCAHREPSPHAPGPALHQKSFSATRSKLLYRWQFNC